MTRHHGRPEPRLLGLGFTGGRGYARRIAPYDSRSTAATGCENDRGPPSIIAAETRVSVCFENDVEHIQEQFHLPGDITTWAMSSKERSNRPSRSLVAFNEAIMKHGAWL